MTPGHNKQAQQQIGKQKESGTQAEAKRLPGRTEGGEEQNRCVNGNGQNGTSVLFEEEPDHSSGTGSGKNCPENPVPPAHLSAALEQQDEGKVEKQKTHDACCKMDGDHDVCCKSQNERQDTAAGQRQTGTAEGEHQEEQTDGACGFNKQPPETGIREQPVGDFRHQGRASIAAEQRPDDEGKAAPRNHFCSRTETKERTEEEAGQGEKENQRHSPAGERSVQPQKLKDLHG